MRRAGIALAVVLLVLTGLVWGGVVLFRSYSTKVTAGCDFGVFSTDTGQADVASTMVSVVVSRQLPSRAAVLVLAAALQESKLRNIPAGQGDRDSVGVLQQRPSQGWGTAAQLADISFATGAFLDRLVEFEGWQTLPLARAIQNVQISADEAAYAQHESQAQAITDALTGATQRGISCRFDAPTQVATPTTVAARLRSELPVNPPSISGTNLTVGGASWTTVGWLIAHADRFGIERVAYAGGRWTRSDGWKNDAQASSAAVTAAMHA